MIQAGVDILDIGGESTRPGATNVSETEEIARVVPVIEKLKHFGVSISIDSSKPAVMKAAVEAGANMINDVRALQLDGALKTAAVATIFRRGRSSSIWLRSLETRLFLPLR